MKQKRWKTDGYLRIFASYYRPHWKLFALDMVCALCICLVDLAFPIVSRFSMQTLLPGQMFTAFFVVMAVLAGAYVLKGCFYYIITYWGHLLGVRMEADIRRDLFSHMQDLSFSFYDKNRTGQLMSRVTGDLFEITELAHHGPEAVHLLHHHPGGLLRHAHHPVGAGPDRICGNPPVHPVHHPVPQADDAGLH